MKHIDISFLRSRRRLAALAAVILLPAATGGYAAPSATWTGGVSDSWNDAGNWSDGIVAGDGTQSPEDVVIGQPTDYVQHSGDHTINTLSNGGYVDFNGAGTLTVDGAIVNDDTFSVTDGTQNAVLSGDSLVNTNYYAVVQTDDSSQLTVNITHGVVNEGVFDARNSSNLILTTGGDIVNDGVIQGYHGGEVDATIGGDLYNNKNIDGFYGNVSLDIAGSVNNSATGAMNANYGSNLHLTIGGDLNNAGRIGSAFTTDQNASNVTSALVGGDIHNTGSIGSAFDGVTFVAAPNGTLTNDGSIYSAFNSTTVAFANQITNNGSVESSFGSGTGLQSLNSLTNSGSMTASFNSTITGSADTDIINQGFVTATQGSLLTLNAGGALTNEATGAIAATQNGEVDLLAGGGDITNHGSIAASEGGVVFIDSRDGAVVSDGSITTDTGGSVIVTGDLTQTGGQTKINGDLQLNDGEGTLYLEDGGLGGGGTIEGSVVQDGGTFAPGDPTTTHITGDYTQNAGKTVFVINDYNSYDQIAVGDAYTYTGGELDFLFSSNFLAGLYSGPHSFDFLSFTSFTNMSGGPIDVVTNLSPQYGFTFDPATSDGTFRGTLTGGTVPEPGAGVIFITALSGLGVLLWKSRRRTVTA